MDEVITKLNNIYSDLLEFLNNISFYMTDFNLVKEEYAKVIISLNKLNQELKLAHPLEYYYVFLYLLKNGYLSYDHYFTKTMDKSYLYDISYHYELDVINGYANCRHIATMFNDVLNNSKFLSGLLLVNASNLLYNRYYLFKKLEMRVEELSKANEEEKDEIIKKIKALKIRIAENKQDILLKGDDDIDIRRMFYNHVINIVNYQNKTYFLDATIGHTYTYNGKSLECFYDKEVPFIFDVSEYSKIRGNKEQDTLKKWVTLGIRDNSKDIEIQNKTNEIIQDNQSLLKDFYDANSKHYEVIVGKLQRYKK